ncbi:DNA-directed RNA polymerase subunit beta' [candidate division KSB1 bacterium]|nr:DNA-directed RNA polymerase subunit beta' [candidate division KSB1 bacterium]
MNKEVSRIGWKRFTRLSIGLASPDKILERSNGEVLKPETINYRSYKPEKDGLFCEKIFGPVKDYECHCGKYKRIRYKGIVCDRCGVEVTTKGVRRERMGHVTLAVPVVHIWFWKSLPSKISYILGISIKDLEKIIYYESYIILQPGKTDFKEKQLIDEDEYYSILSEEEPGSEDRFIAKTGGEAILDMLRIVDVVSLSPTLREQARTETSQQRKTEVMKRLKVIEAFKPKDGGRLNKPEWMVLTVLPVIPPELRPLVPLEGGRFATSDLNDLYRRVIIRNNRLKKLMEIKAPEVILKNEKRMLQEAVDSLLDNGRKSIAVRGDGNRALKSLSDMLKGKQGRFRQNLLGKRIDYSGRSVIVVGPELQMHECGLPKEMALELFKPFIINKLVQRHMVKTVKSAKKLVERRGPEVWDILEEIIEDHPVMLNRAPTLHRLGIQAFQPILVEGLAIRIHPLVCAAFNADFDGDQMAVHVPLSFEAQAEVSILMLASHNILSPANGKPLAIPSQDMVIGCYYLTKAKSGDLGEGMSFSSKDEVLIAFNNNKVGLHARIKVLLESESIETTTGRVIFNQCVPEGFGFVNELLSKKRIEEIVGEAYLKLGNYETVKFLDRLKEVGFHYATRSSVSIGLDDVQIPEAKDEIIIKAYDRVDKIQKRYEKGVITDGERYNQVIDIWTNATNAVAEEMFDHLKDSNQGFNPLFMMADSGARGSKEQIRQLAGMRGLMAKPQKKMTGSIGEIIESPITANFKEGLSVLEYFISTHGARKGLADTALKTADAGYLTRRLVDVAQDVTITVNDCGTILGLKISDLKEGEEIIEPLRDRILGRVCVEDVFDLETSEVLAEAGTLIDEYIADRISDAGIETVYIRSVLTCEAPRGVCTKCYGRNLGTNRNVETGEAVGVMAAQSIGEPGTQLTLRTFHIGGTASRIAAQSRATAKSEGSVQFENLRLIDQADDTKVTLRRNGKIKIVDDNNRITSQLIVPYGAKVLVKDNDKVQRGDVLFSWDPYSVSILASNSGKVVFRDLIEKVTYKEELDETSGKKQQVIIDTRSRTLSPQIAIVDNNGEDFESHILPTGAFLICQDGQNIRAGDVLVKIPREIAKTRDITGGLPRVAELFEARKPKDPAIVSEIDGVVKFGEIRKGIRKMSVTSHDGVDEKSYNVPYGKHVLVHEGDFVTAGEKLTEGSVAPQDILNILGPNKVQEYLVNEIQEVYRLQGVRINDKHIEVIVRQMLQKVKVEDPGDTQFLEGDLVDKFRFLNDNEKLMKQIVITDPGDSKYFPGEMITPDEFAQINERLEKIDGRKVTARQPHPATFKPVLLGITKSSLSTESFISAASFQETTRVLADAAIAGKVDNLYGLKENVVMGNLIPAGTGLKVYSELYVSGKEEEEEEVEEEPTVNIEDMIEEEQEILKLKK